jgi:hypothetical protein
MVFVSMEFHQGQFTCFQGLMEIYCWCLGCIRWVLLNQLGTFNCTFKLHFVKLMNCKSRFHITVIEVRS